MKLMQLCVGMVRTNCYIVYDEATREAAVIDPATMPSRFCTR